MPRSARGLFFAFAAVFGCGEGGRADLGAGPTGAADAGCDARPCEDVPLLADGPCAPGTAPRIGAATCVPIGPSCDEGFAKAESGWGCVPVLADACEGASRAALGTTSCVPVGGDCDAPFPPPGTTHLVDARYPTDRARRRYRYVGEAAAEAPAGSVIAVEAGTYPEYWSHTRPVTLVGRCAAQVVILGDGTKSALQTKASLVVRGLTFRGQKEPIMSFEGAPLVVEDVVIERPRFEAIVVLAGGRLEVRRTVVRDLVLYEDYGTAIDVSAGTDATLEDVTFERVAQNAIDLAGPGTRARLARVVVHDVSAGGPGVGWGLVARDGAEVEATDVAVVRAASNGIVSMSGASLRLERAYVGDVAHDPRRETANGVLAGGDGIVDATNLTVVGVQGIGVRSLLGGTLTLRSSVVVGGRVHDTNGDLGVGAYAHAGGALDAFDTAFVGNRRTAVEAHDVGTRVRLERVHATATAAAPEGRNGGGVLAATGSEVDLVDTVLEGNLQQGIWALGARRLHARDTAIRRTALSESGGEYGHGVLAVDTPDVLLDGLVVDGNAAAGVAAVASTVLFVRSVVHRNAVGVHTEGGTQLVELPVGASEAPPGALGVGRDVRFVDNGARAGTGALPVPVPVTAVGAAP